MWQFLVGAGGLLRVPSVAKVAKYIDQVSGSPRHYLWLTYNRPFPLRSTLLGS